MREKSRLLEIPAQADVDAIVAMSPENFAYVSGTFILTVESIRPRQAFAVLPRQSQPFAVFCSIETPTMRDESWIDDLVEYTEFVDHPADKLAEALTARGLHKGKIGIDLGYLPQASFARLHAKLPGAEFIDTTDTIAAIRAIKDPDEVAQLEFAAKGTHQAVLDAMAASKLGDTEKQMADRISKGIIENGANTTLFMCFGSGARTRFAHGAPSDRVPLEGDMIRFDLGGRYGPYYSDFARTFSAGNPSPAQRDYYRKLVEIHKETIGAVRPGVTAEYLFNVCKDGFEKRQLPFHMPHIGHSFGVELHENPMLRPGDKTEIKPGMVINIEPVFIDPDNSLYHVEDLFVVTEDGYRLLTLGFPQDELPVIGTLVPS